MQKDETQKKVESLKDLASNRVLSLFASADHVIMDKQLILANKTLPKDLIELLQKKMPKDSFFTYFITFYAITSIERLKGTLEFTQFNIDKKNGGGYTLLHKAVSEEYPEMVQYLLQHGASVDVETEIGDSPLHIACANGNTQIIQLLLNSNTVKVNALRVLDRITPLHILAGKNPKNKQPQKQLVINIKLLLAAGADLTKKNNMGNTPLECAKNPEIIQLLENHEKNNKNE